MKNNLKSNQGITLIALVITIIVLLILAGVAINMLAGDNGILRQAAKAKENTAVSSIEEQLKLAVLTSRTEGLGDIDFTTLNTELKKIDNNIEEVTSLPKNLSIKGNDYRIDENGNVVSALWYYDDNGNVTNGRLTLEIGDEVFYKVKKDEKCEITSDESGYTGSEKQVFNTSDYEGGWQVLGVEDGKIMLTSSKGILPAEGGEPVGGGFTLEGGVGYAKGIDALNKISTIYGKGTGADGTRHMTIEDVNRLTGFNPDEYEHPATNYYRKKIKYTKNSSDGYIYYQVVQDGELQSTIKSSDKIFIYSKGTEFVELQSGESIEMIANGYWYESSEYSAKTEKANHMIFQGDSSGCGYVVKDNPSYWLASRSITAYPGGTMYYDFLTVYYQGVSNTDGLELFSSNGFYDHEMGLAVRPVVYLKSDIKLTGSSDAGWSIK